MVFHWHKSFQVLILPVGTNTTGLIMEQARPTTVTLDLDDIEKLMYNQGYLKHLASALRPIPRKNQQGGKTRE